MALKGYSEVKDCIRANHDAYPDCVEISTRRVEMNDSYVEVEATVVRHVDPTDWDKVLTYTGIALEQIVTYDDLKPYQKDNPNKAPVNYASYLENCETSAIGRALRHAGFFDLENMGNAPSEEEIQQNQRNAETLHKRGKAKQEPVEGVANIKDAKKKKKATGTNLFQQVWELAQERGLDRKGMYSFMSDELGRDVSRTDDLNDDELKKVYDALKAREDVEVAL